MIAVLQYSEPDYAARVASFNLRCAHLDWPMRGDPELAFESPRLRDALAVWQRIAGGRRFPARVDMTPRSMKAFLSDVGIVDVLPGDPYRRFHVRIVGTSISRVLGNLSGCYLSEAVPEPYLSRWQAMLSLPLETRAPIRTVSPLEFRDQTYLRVETLLAPLGPASHSCDAILVVMHAHRRSEIPQNATEADVRNSIRAGVSDVESKSQ